MAPEERAAWLADQRMSAVKIALKFSGPDALVMLVQPPDGRELFVLTSGPGPGRRDGGPEGTPDRRLVDAYRESGQLVEVLHTPESWGCEILPR